MPISVGNFGSIAVIFNQLLKDLAAGCQTPVVFSMEQFALLLPAAPASIARWYLKR